MQEIFEFRIPEKWACEWLNRDDGVVNRSASVRVVKAPYGSELYDRVLAAERERRTADDRFFLSWAVRRRYDARELAAAEMLTVRIRYAFEPVGEDFGAVYLPNIHGPAETENRVGSLKLKCSRFRGNSLCMSIAGERLISSKFQALVRECGLTGLGFGPVFCAESHTEATSWAEIIVTSRKASIAAPTIVGDGPLDLPYAATDTNRDHLGLNVLTEVSIQRDTWDGADFIASRQTVGHHQGVLRPERILFVSQRAFAALPSKMKQEIDFEVTHLIP